MAQTAEILEALPPAQAQPGGLALLDLNVTATPLVITWDKDAVSTLLDAALAQYAGLEIREADVPAIKNEMAGLNRLRERMDNARKDIKRRIAGPLDGFDAEVKALIARIVDARTALDTQVKDFERRDREGRRTAVQFVVDNIKSCEGVPELDIPINPSWLNKSTRISNGSSPHTSGSAKKPAGWNRPKPTASRWWRPRQRLRRKNTVSRFPCRSLRPA